MYAKLKQRPQKQQRCHRKYCGSSHIWILSFHIFDKFHDDSESIVSRKSFPYPRHDSFLDHIAHRALKGFMQISDNVVYATFFHILVMIYD